MSERIQHLHSANDQMLMIRGDDPAEIHRAACAWVAEDDPDGGLEVADTVEDIHVGPIRTVPGCVNGCGCGNPGPHYIPGGGRGSFWGAFVILRVVPWQERRKQVASAG